VCVACGAGLDNPAARALLGQTILGVYQLIDVIGKGGMSIVYKARHKMTDQVVALKILPAELAIHADIKARFIEEAKALARLEHPHIVRLYNFGEEGGRFVLAMQYVEGTTLERRIFSAGRLEWRAAVRVIAQVLSALEYAHKRGIIHRDIKPSNILVRGDGSTMVMDFGIAKMAEGSSRLTATGQTMGTVRYMSPEQVRGQVVDHRSDLYSVGATLYEALTGDTPYDGSTHFEIMMKHLNAPVPSARSGGAPDTPVGLEAVLLRALAKDVGARYQSAAQFLADLDGVLEAAGDSAAPIGTAPRRGGRGGEPETTEYPAIARLVPPAQVTGIAKVVEPEHPSRPRPAPRRRGVLIVAGAAAVLAAAAGAFALLRGGGPAAAPDARQVADAAAEPFLAGGFAPVIDRRFERPVAVRVLAARELDAEGLAAAYAAAVRRFTAYVDRTAGVAVETPALNLVVAPASVLCTPELHAAPPPDDCLARPPRFVYPPRRRTLYLLDDEHLERVNLVEGASAHVCISTPALLELRCMKNFLPPFWEEIERDAVR
jgi:tRNA A-37 threonylcarbamoyl transferase component Bud32